MEVRAAVAVFGLLALDACRDDPPAIGNTGCPSAACGSSGSTVGDASGSASTAPSRADSTSTAGSTSATTMATTVGGSESSTGPVLEPSSERHTKRPLGETASPQGYWEYLPPTYDEASPHPLLVYVHGIGANGDGSTDELDRVLINGPARLISDDQWSSERPFVVLSPQHGGGGCTTPGEIQSFLAYAIGAYAVEPSRVYLTGISCGAFGGWDYLANFFDDQVAAAVLIAGDGRGAFALAGCAMGVVPLWAFHGDIDDVVDPQGTIEPVEGLLACEPPPGDVQMTIFPDVRHDSWSRVYDLSAGHDIYAWLLSH